MSPELLFQKYSVPCAYVLEALGRISKEELGELEKATIENVALPRDKLERVFIKAVERMERTAKKLDKDTVWDEEVILEYFFVDHTSVIDNGEGYYADAPESFKELCKVYKAKVVEVGDRLTVEYGDVTRRVKSELVPGVKMGDIVTIHHKHAVEIL